MDAWGTVGGETPPEGEQGKPKKSKTADSRAAESKKASKPQMMTARLALQTATLMRMVCSILLATWLVPTTASCIEPIMKARREYASKTKGMKGHSLGRPDQWVWGRLIYETALILKEKADGRLQLLQNYLKKYPTPVLLPRVIYVARLQDCFDEGKKRLSLRVEEAEHCEVGAVVAEVLTNYWKATLQEGGAPRGYLEREIQMLVDRKPKDGKSEGMEDDL